MVKASRHEEHEHKEGGVLGHGNRHSSCSTWAKNRSLWRLAELDANMQMRTVVGPGARGYGKPLLHGIPERSLLILTFAFWLKDAPALDIYVQAMPL